MLLKHLFLPSFPLAEERVVKRSDDRVSKYTSGISANALACIYSPRLRYACRPSLRLRRKEGEEGTSFNLMTSCQGSKLYCAVVSPPFNNEVKNNFTDL